MNRVILMCILIITMSSFISFPPASINKSTVHIIQPTPLKDTLNKKDFLKLKIKDYEKYTGKKLTLKEKIAFKIVRQNLRKSMGPIKKPEEETKGKTALILGILSIVVLSLVFIPYAFIASLPLAIIAIVMGNKAKKIDPSDKKARGAVTLGWVTIGLHLLFLAFMLAALIVLIVLTGWG
jgi:hypothetical protein